MEYTEGIITEHKTILHDKELEQASNAYLMAIVAVVIGLPLPVINLIASAIYYLGNLRSSYFVRWHCLQAVLTQCLLIPFNSFALAWVISLIINHEKPSWAFGFYITGIIILNLCEFVAIMVTASKVRKGENIRWFIVAGIADMLCSKKTDPYSL